MKTLYLVRHASASIDAPTKKDIDRPLNSTGIEEAETMAKYLRKIKVQIDLIVSSHAERAKTTAVIFAKHFFYPLVNILLEEKIYTNKPDDTLDFLFSCEDTTQNILLVGHNPVITQLANELSNHSVSSMKPAGIACIEFNIEKWSEIKQKGELKFYMDCALL